MNSVMKVLLLGVCKDYLAPELSLPPERPNRGAIHAGYVAVTRGSAKALSESCPTPVGVPSEAPGSAGGKRRHGVVDETTSDGADAVGCGAESSSRPV